MILAIAFSLVLLASAASADGLAANDGVIFQGFPFHRVVIEEIDKPRAELIPEEKKAEFRIEIVRKDGEFFWASREDKPLVYIGRSGLFETWLAAGGSGYIRIAPQAANDPSADATQFVYMEHLVNRLGSVTYWGKGYLSR